MSPAQLAAFRTWLLSALRQPVEWGGPAVPFADDAIYRANRNAPRSVFPLCEYNPIAVEGQGIAHEQVLRHARMAIDVRFDTVPAGPFTVTITPHNPMTGATLSPVSVAVTPGADVNATRTAMLAALQSFITPPGEAVVAAYGWRDGDIVTIEATEDARGAWLQLDMGTAAGDVTTFERSNLLVHSRELKHAVVSVRLWSKLDEQNPDPNLEAYHWLERVVGHAFSEHIAGPLDAARCPIVAHSDVRDLTTLANGGAEWITMANVDITLEVAPFHVEQALTVEALGLSGTIDTVGGGSISVGPTTIPGS